MEIGGTGFSAGELAPLLSLSFQSQDGGGGFPPRGGLEIASSKGVGIEEGGFPSMFCWLGALLLRAEGLETWGVVGQVDFFPLYPSLPICWCVCARVRARECVCVHTCLLLRFLYLFVILGRGWLGWPAGSWEGFSCWRFQIELVSGWAQLLRDCHIPC